MNTVYQLPKKVVDNINKMSFKKLKRYCNDEYEHQAIDQYTICQLYPIYFIGSPEYIGYILIKYNEKNHQCSQIFYNLDLFNYLIYEKLISTVVVYMQIIDNKNIFLLKRFILSIFDSGSELEVIPTKRTIYHYQADPKYDKYKKYFHQWHLSKKDFIINTYQNKYYITYMNNPYLAYDIILCNTKSLLDLCIKEELELKRIAFDDLNHLNIFISKYESTCILMKLAKQLKFDYTTYNFIRNY